MSTPGVDSTRMSSEVKIKIFFRKNSKMISAHPNVFYSKESNAENRLNFKFHTRISHWKHFRVRLGFRSQELFQADTLSHQDLF